MAQSGACQSSGKARKHACEPSLGRIKEETSDSPTPIRIPTCVLLPSISSGQDMRQKHLESIYADVVARGLAELRSWVHLTLKCRANRRNRHICSSGCQASTTTVSLNCRTWSAENAKFSRKKKPKTSGNPHLTFCRLHSRPSPSHSTSWWSIFVFATEIILEGGRDSRTARHIVSGVETMRIIPIATKVRRSGGSVPQGSVARIHGKSLELWQSDLEAPLLLA